MNVSTLTSPSKPSIRVTKTAKTNKPIRKKIPSRPITTGPGHVFSKFVDKVTIRPNKQLIIPIGNTFTGTPPKGFSIGLSPGNSANELVEMQVVTSGTPHKYEYKLQVTNNGTKTVCAEVWAL